MARFYASFTNATVPAIEALDGNNFYQQLNMTNGSTIRAALVSTRDALSAAMYAQMETVNKNGLLGTTVPTDGYTISGGNFEGSNLYTHPQAVWQSDPRNARTSVASVTNITVSNSTAVSPADPFSVLNTLYTDATTAVNNALNAIAAPVGYTGNGPYARIGLDTFRTLASVWTDHALTYIAWDDYTPGTPTIQPPTKPAAQARSLPLVIPVTWNNEYVADRAGNAIIYARLDKTNGGSDFYIMANNVSQSALVLSYDATLPAYSLPAGEYRLTYRVRFQDATITAHLSDNAEYVSAADFVVLTP